MLRAVVPTMNVIIKYGAAYEQPTSIVTGGSPRLVAAMADMKDTSRTGKSNRHENIVPLVCSTGLLKLRALYVTPPAVFPHT